ncbi:hypothetical protein Agabi119p4_11048 [Agaricus bisporus var. burnettii]|uniref:Aminoglycoside phosphotransferase domain-containing protein n=1 Tax=Agaricus bisporus var. burnettii TaxID=192524 RepID=A0A8H7C126_AGABI|nr:hypothetical protein Agabi119p4_11048 [Agaricus bisporus var. burnettii]
MSVHTTSLQGGDSYTVVSRDETCVVQFRAGYAALDNAFLGCIEEAYDGFTPRHKFVGKLGELHVYTMGNIGGVSMYLARDQLNQDNFRLLKYTVKDFASLLAANWPLVPNHTDLLENNIHVSKETGHLMGICDWKDTTIGPFGMSLGGLETMLGKRTMSKGWCYHSKQQELRDMFWETLYQTMGGVSEEQKTLIDVARLVGLFLDNGFEWNLDEVKVPASEGNDDLCYLEAVTLTLWAQTDKR